MPSSQRDVGSTPQSEFQTFHLETESNLFHSLIASAVFEKLGKGRKGTVLVAPDENLGAPLVRTTAKFAKPANEFAQVHFDLVKQIQKATSQDIDFNNALIESYTNAYTKMGFHSDMALDLEKGSFIALYSCYKNGESTKNPRKLIVQSKESTKGKTNDSNPIENFEVSLPHNSLVIFSVETNKNYRHKIVLTNVDQKDENQWLGVTFRRSKTFVKYEDDKALFSDGRPLTLANDEQRDEFFALRRRENQEIDFDYPQLSYTICESDLMIPTASRGK